MTIGEKIYILRTKSGMTQEQLAEKMGVSRQAISKWESDVSVPELNKLKALANLFQVSLDEMMGEKPLLEVQEQNIVKEPDKQKINWIFSSIQSVAIIILGISLIIQSGSIRQLRNDIEYLRAENARLSSMIVTAPDEPSESMFQEYYFELGEVQEDTKTYIFSVSCMPVEFTDSTKITLTLEDTNGENYSIELEEKNGIFEGKKEMPVCSIAKVLFMQENEGVKRVQEIYDVGVDIMQRVYPEFCIRMSIKDTIEEIELGLLEKEYEVISPESKRLDAITLQIYDGQDAENPRIIWERELTNAEVEQIINEEKVKVPVELQEETLPEFVGARVVFEHALMEGEQSVDIGTHMSKNRGVLVCEMSYWGGNSYIEQ